MENPTFWGMFGLRLLRQAKFLPRQRLHLEVQHQSFAFCCWWTYMVLDQRGTLPSVDQGPGLIMHHV